MAPSLEYSKAIARPIPEPAPVMIATFLSSVFISFIVSSKRIYLLLTETSMIFITQFAEMCD